MFDYLDGFEKRIEFAAIVDTIVNRKNTSTEIEGWFEGNELDNLFFSVLVFIMEQTLNENDECTIDKIAEFLDEIMPNYGKDMSFDKTTILAEYTIKDILQNKGLAKYFDVMNYSVGMTSIRVRLISDKLTDDNKIIYQLTDQGYDFLFRTKEIDKELNFKLEQFKLKELLKRRNYKHAVAQSRELISMLRQEKKQIDDFIYRVRQNINEIDKNEYEQRLNQTYRLIDEEYNAMQDIKKSVDADRARIDLEKEENGYLDDTMTNALENLMVINRNLDIVISEQRNLIARRFSMNNVYEDTIKNSFFAEIIKRYDFEKEILIPMEQINEDKMREAFKFFGPLNIPNMQKHLNLNLLYQRQGKIREVDTNEYGIEDEELKDDKIKEKIKKNNAINYNFVEYIFKYAALKKDIFKFSELYENIREKTEKLQEYTNEKRIFIIMLKLYQLGEINIADWVGQNQDSNILEANGEFDMEWILFQMFERNKDFFEIETLKFEKLEGISLEIDITDETMEFEEIKSKIVMEDILIIPELRKS